MTITEFVANLLPCNDAPQGTSCEAVCMDWWLLEKTVRWLLSGCHIRKGGCLGDDDIE